MNGSALRIETLDLRFQGTPRAIAAFLVFGPEGPVLVETGPGSTLPALVDALGEHGVAVGDVRHVLVTHIHLDHAGAAGWWAQQGSQVYVHPLGAPHLIDPGKLLASATRIYGDRMGPLWGDVLAAPAARVTAVGDGEVVEAGGIELTALHTPGHAGHHIVYRLGEIAFTGDAAAIRIPGLDWIDLPAPPPEFDLEVWRSTLDRLRGAGLRTFYRTHFGRSDDVAADLDRLERLLDETAGIVRGLLARRLEREEMLAAYREWLDPRLVAAGADEEKLRVFEVANPRDMSVDGIARYWRKREESG